MSRKSSKMLDKVNARALAEREAKAKAHKGDVQKDLCISDDEIMDYIHKNRKGDAILYNRLNSKNIIYVAEWEKFLFWNGHHWEIDYKNCQTCIAIENVCKVYEEFAYRKQQDVDQETDKDKKNALQRTVDKIYRRVDSLRDKKGQNDLLEMVNRVDPPLFTLPKAFDQQPYLKACKNGVIDLRTGELLPGTQEQYLLKAIPTEYDPELLNVENPCPEVSKYLLSSLGDQTIVEFIWRLLGYGMITKRKDHIFVIFWGEHGRNGKDTLIKLVTKVMGEDLSADVGVEMFLQTGQTRNSSSATPDIMDLKGMCFAWINEAEENQKFAHGKLKKLTGGGNISARGNYDKGITKWEQTHLPIMATNELPRAKADDAPFWERAIIVKWPFSFVDNPEAPHQRQADKDLDEKVEAEAKGFLAMMVRGAMEYCRDGLNVPEIIREWTKEQRNKFDDIGQFLNEWCELEPYQENSALYTTRTSSSDLHEAFCIWYAIFRDKKYSISPKKFAELLNKKNIAYKRSNGSWRLGIILNNLAHKEMDEYKESK